MSVNGDCMIRGIDISNHQRDVDWAAVARSGVEFAFIKASEDTAYRDPYFARNWIGAKQNGLVPGAYHYANPDETTPAASVDMFANMIDSVGGLTLGDHVILDIESGTGDLSDWVTRWMGIATERFSVKPWLYSGHWFTEPHGLEIPALGKYPLWYASYQADLPPVPAGWVNIHMWQISASGSVPGVNGDCDENLFYGSANDLRAIGYQGPSVVVANQVTPESLRDDAWRIAEAFASIGYPWTADGIKSSVALSKGER